MRRLQHTSPGSQDLESVPLVPEYNMEVKEMQAVVNQGLGILMGIYTGSVLFHSQLFCLTSEPEVPYNVTVKPLNAAGCGPEQQLYCFTREGGIENTSCL